MALYQSNFLKEKYDGKLFRIFHLTGLLRDDRCTMPE